MRVAGIIFNIAYHLKAYVFPWLLIFVDSCLRDGRCVGFTFQTMCTGLLLSNIILDNSPPMQGILILLQLTLIIQFLLQTTVGNLGSSVLGMESKLLRKDKGEGGGLMTSLVKIAIHKQIFTPMPSK